MTPPPISLFLTTIASQPALRQRQEYLLRILQVKQIPFVSYDLASDEVSKQIWKRRVPAHQQQLPGILVGGQYPGTFAQFEEAVEHDELDLFLRLKEEWRPDSFDGRPLPEQQAIGVPGACLPLQMTSDDLREKILAQKKSAPTAKPSPDDHLSHRFSEIGIHGVRATEAELEALVAELGLGGDESGGLVQNRHGSSASLALSISDLEERTKEGSTEVLASDKGLVPKKSASSHPSALRTSDGTLPESIEEDTQNHQLEVCQGSNSVEAQFAHVEKKRHHFNSMPDEEETRTLPIHTQATSTLQVAETIVLPDNTHSDVEEIHKPIVKSLSTVANSVPIQIIIPSDAPVTETCSTIDELLCSPVLRNENYTPTLVEASHAALKFSSQSSPATTFSHGSTLSPQHTGKSGFFPLDSPKADTLLYDKESDPQPGREAEKIIDDLFSTLSSSMAPETVLKHRVSNGAQYAPNKDDKRAHEAQRKDVDFAGLEPLERTRNVKEEVEVEVGKNQLNCCIVA